MFCSSQWIARYFGVLRVPRRVPQNEGRGTSIVKQQTFLPLLVVLAALALPFTLSAQDNAETPLGDIARALRKNKEKPVEHPVVIDNDNLGKVMEQAEAQHAKGEMKFFLDGGGKDARAASPDVICSLSFSADGAAQASSGTTILDLPTSEILKLDGPATISGDTLQVAVYNGTEWKIKEITVGLTILRPADTNASFYGSAQLRPAAAGDDAPGQKRSDVTVLYHLNGLATPYTTSVFRQSIGVSLSAGQEWHWAIVQARGIPPR